MMACSAGSGGAPGVIGVTGVVGVGEGNGDCIDEQRGKGLGEPALVIQRKFRFLPLHNHVGRLSQRNRCGGIPARRRGAF